MFTALAVVSVVLAALLASSAALKLSHRPSVVNRYARVGVREQQLNALAGILMLGAVGVLMGLAWAPIGIAAAGGLVAYFALAIAAHIRAGDTTNLLTPVVIEILSVIAFALRLASNSH